MGRARAAAPGRARRRAREAGASAPGPGAAVTRPADTRARILDAAEELFAEHGFEATPTARIAEDAGVAKGLLFYYFHSKTDLLHALLAERPPEQPTCGVATVARRGDLPGSLVRMAHALDLGGRQSRVLRAILFRDMGVHPEIAEHLRRLRAGLVELTEQVLDAASPSTLNRLRRREAADTYVSLMLYEAHARRHGSVLPDLTAAAAVVARALGSPAFA